MKIVDLQVIPCRVPRIPFNAGKLLPETTVTQTLTKVITDEGAEGYPSANGGAEEEGANEDVHDHVYWLACSKYPIHAHL